MTAPRQRLVSFAMPPEYSRMLSDEEHSVLRKFTGHVQKCDGCYVSRKSHSRIMSVCSRGYSYARDLQQYITFQKGTAYSTIDIGPGGKPVRIEIAEGDLPSNVLQVLKNGFRIDEAAFSGQQQKGRRKITKAQKSAMIHDRAFSDYSTLIESHLSTISSSLARLETVMSTFLVKQD